MSGSIEREGFTLAPCTRLRTCMLRVLLRYSPSHNNDPDVRGFVTLLATLASPLLKTLTLSLYIQDAEDSSTARRVRFDELQAFDWASIGAMLGPTRLPALQKLLVEGTERLRSCQINEVALKQP
ncbi:hypothetical protein EVJ58_g8996 [Rhodofomes roseus]|uniref:Uncharacterized protein n=1 Tax=Rhodofomes roseus TaxID=34475 RepID=A0A4Y9XWN5_9APHY|nr:hypothetical protein EVJ58_g8996 [Rhodofomes roseus]